MSDRILVLLAALTGLWSALPVAAGDWPQFLGPDRNGTSSETKLINSWPSGGPKEVWRIKGGVGMSGVVVRGPLAVTLVQREGKQIALAVDATTGKDTWATPLAELYENQQGDGPRATPAITAEAVYCFTGDGVLAALKPEGGGLLWRKNVLESHGGETADYGMASSPLIAGKLVVVTAGASGAAVVAYDRLSGKLAWKAGDGPAGYSSPALLNVAGKDQVVAFIGNAALGIDPDSGKVLWEYSYVTDYECNIATPLSIDGNLFLSSGENHGAVLLDLTNASRPREVWSSQGPRSVLRNEWQTSVLIDGYLYGFDNVGSAGPVTHLTCIDAKTGERKWQQARFGKGNLIAAEGKLFLTTMKGELVVARASPKSYEELGRKVVLDTTRQAPALANGLLYLRDNQDVVCVSVRESE